MTKPVICAGSPDYSETLMKDNEVIRNQNHCHQHDEGSVGFVGLVHHQGSLWMKMCVFSLGMAVPTPL